MQATILRMNAASVHGGVATVCAIELPLNGNSACTRR